MSAPARRILVFDRPAEVISDIQHLRRGHQRVGSWKLPQACWHLRTMIDRSVPRRVATPEPAKRHSVLQEWITASRIPDALETDPQFVPPADVGDSEMGCLIFSMTKLEEPEALFVDHPIFGAITAEENRRFHLIHCAHHLGYFVPRRA